MTNWLLVSSPENFERVRALGFPFLMMKSRHLRKAERVAPGDRVLYYAVGVMGFAGSFEVTSTYFESHEPLFVSKKDAEDYPYRFAVKPSIVLPTGSFVSAESLLSELQWVKKWPADHWRLAFQGNVHVLADDDYLTIENSLRAALAPVLVS